MSEKVALSENTSTTFREAAAEMSINGIVGKWCGILR